MLFEPFAVIVSFYALATRARSRRDRRILAALIGYAIVALALIAANTEGLTASKLGSHVVALALLPAIVGLVVARRWQLTDRLAAMTAELRVEQEIRVSRAAALERARIARDLHDVVAHGVSVMVLKAAGARLNLATDPQAARSAWRVVIASGREALMDLRRIIGMFRADPASPGVARFGRACRAGRRGRGGSLSVLDRCAAVA
jgi:signal transduction histidine kinase